VFATALGSRSHGCLQRREILAGVHLFGCEICQSVRRQYDVDALEIVATNPRRLQAERRIQNPPAIGCRLFNGVVTGTLDPEIKILITDGAPCRTAALNPVSRKRIPQRLSADSSARSAEVSAKSFTSKSCGQALCWWSTGGHAARDRDPRSSN
jgi:hypothetical protein